MRYRWHKLFLFLFTDHILSIDWLKKSFCVEQFGHEISVQSSWELIFYVDHKTLFSFEGVFDYFDGRYLVLVAYI